MLRPAALGHLPEQLVLLQLVSTKVVALTQAADAEKQKFHKLNIVSLKIKSSLLKQVTSGLVSDGHRTHAVTRQDIFFIKDMNWIDFIRQLDCVLTV